VERTTGSATLALDLLPDLWANLLGWRRSGTVVHAPLRAAGGSGRWRSEGEETVQGGTIRNTNTNTGAIDTKYGLQMREYGGDTVRNTVLQLRRHEHTCITVVSTRVRHTTTTSLAVLVAPLCHENWPGAGLGRATELNGHLILFLDRRRLVPTCGVDGPTKPYENTTPSSHPTKPERIHIRNASTVASAPTNSNFVLRLI
jgi:hypothetical protein